MGWPDPNYYLFALGKHKRTIGYSFIPFRDKWYDQLDEKQKKVVDFFYQAHLAYEKLYGSKKKAPEPGEEEIDPFEGFDMPTL